MQASQPPQAATEDATAHLLRMAFLEIRFFTSRLHDDQSAEAITQRRDRANEIADICHNLPGLLGPTHRSNLAEGLRHKWRTANARKRQWLRTHWDQIDYDHRWLTEPESSPPTANDPTDT